MPNPTLVQFDDGVVIHGTFPSPEVLTMIREAAGGPIALVVADPPYGNTVDEEWDKTTLSDVEFMQWMISWTKELEPLCHPGAAAYIWGGVGFPKDGKKPPFRPFLRYLVEVELQTGFNLSSPITWKKKRAYGIQWGYLFTREEVAYLVLGDVKKPRKFTVPLLDAKRGYAGYSTKYPAKSEYLRRSNVWDDITEVMRGKTHVNQKPTKLMEVPIEIHTEPGEFVLDPFAGSGTTAFAARKLGRKFILVEQDEGNFNRICDALRGPIDFQALAEASQDE